MMTHLFKIGDTVKLKAGGPDMSVRTLPGATSSIYTCQWFAGKKLENGNFPEGSLEPVIKKAE
ncbi:DUF2158 domain-containing protein [Glaciimonas sp. Cout2]|uniref:YodC family protein n=1 Tax=Glaciimonas sp. Cout2 TaxID=3048621 RepID=UPI002B22CA09|nr:DUF2158 domain-containing protein [Glaciimonas sp. Cout2]MEB0014488.1 DUF2158 domain-containing protein [Glaciimonas sp. Cout2]